MRNGNKKVVVITGASAGLGRAIAREFAREGADIALIARGKEGLEGAAREVEKLGGRAIIFSIDVSDAKAVDMAASETENVYGPIDVWVNNAMTSVFSPVMEMEPEEYKRVTEVTYLGQVYGAISALKRMFPRDKGSVLFVGSALAYRGIPLQSAYCASKHAIEGFYDSLRSELIHYGSKIKTCMVQLPAMNTTQFGFVKSRLPNKPKPMGEIYDPEIAARAIVYASKHNRREIYVGGSTIQAIIGNKIAPWYADWILAKKGFEGQQTNEPEDPDRKDNLWAPIPGDHGVYGPFELNSKNFSPQVWTTTHPATITAASFMLAVTVGFILTRMGIVKR